MVDDYRKGYQGRQMKRPRCLMKRPRCLIEDERSKGYVSSRKG